MSTRRPFILRARRRSILRYTFALSLLAIVAYLFGSACGQDSLDFVRGESSETRTSGMTLSVQTDPDVAQMRFTVDRVACDAADTFEPMSYTHTGNLEDLQLPAGIPEFVGRPYDADSKHAFADHYVVLEAGCYNIAVEPLDSAGAASDACTAATQNGVRVTDGQTTEVVLISQCEGAKTGGLDVVATLNTAPTITGLVYQPSKFVNACLPNEICASATDPDGDPIEFVWTRVSGPDASGQPSVLSHTRDGDTVTECMQVTPDTVGTYDYRVTAYDTGYDDTNNSVRLEELSGQPSHDTLNFPLYAAQGDVDHCEDDDEDEPCVEVAAWQLRDAGSTIVDGNHAILVVPANACPTKVSFTSYGFDDYTPEPFEEQNLFDNVTDVYGPGTYDIFVELPPTCGWQTDLYTGDAIHNLIPNVGIAGELLIAAATGANFALCDVPTPN